ncbi:Tetratricopeptide repeat protein [Metarhizium robertsii ARSEF 23]|uniref:Tetratricopeptide repeat protein n=1 Tax=Metarhizium robertsii (strain ARSEF 23 / ATCC MYA-3075) TaxID=655844 RepID=E9ETU4_METRA|nr:Tetratricopeptide repeat protein [Metarhizium robertsii ARSEF 23]EFZ00847.1 Tetratricopeptide repeat protein [Metarhizium robertsii ARSEF 23]
MAPNPAAVGGLLRQVIYYHLDNASYDNALFFAERFAAQDPKATDAAYLYSLSHLRLGDYRSAYDISKPMGYRGVNLGCTWVFAQACLALERYKDGIVALEKSKSLWPQKCSLGKHTATTRAAFPDTPALLCLLGKLHRGYGDKKKAVSCFEDSLKKNPFMWDAFTALCDMGINVRVPNIFRSNESLLQSFDSDIGIGVIDHLREASASAGIPVDAVSLKRSTARNMPADLGSDPFSIGFSSTEMSSPVVDMFTEAPENDFMSKIQSARLRLAASANIQPPSIVEGMETPTGLSTLSDATATRPIYGQEPPQAPARRTRNAQGIDAGLDAPPRMSYRLGTKRNGRPGQEQHAVETVPDGPATATATATTTSTRAGHIAATERKRTLSGHPVPRSTNTDEHMTRRSARLNMFKPSTKANSGAATIGTSAGRELKKARPPVSRIMRPGSSGSSVGRVVSGNRKPVDDQADIDHGESSRTREPAPPPAPSKTIEPDTVKVEEALKWTLDLMKKLGNGYYALSRFQCQDAIQAFSSLPSAQQGTPWVLSQLGRSHYEQAAYAEAEKFFRRMRVQAPSRLQDMEVYSTILWHLKRETDLSFLAHELVDSAWHSPQAWCALGNAWSLARDPEQALRCFKRATQLDPKFAYAFTLQGHEHVTNEEYDKALTAYRQAIAADRRHYNAYYGIGRVQERLGAYEKAYDHYYAAQTINPNNAVLICCMGGVLEKQKQMVQALHAYTKAAELAPRAAQTRYKKARALLTVGQIEAAQKELMILKDLAPDEATVHFLLGTLYRSTNERQLAVRHFTIALALDPKSWAKAAAFYSGAFIDDNGDDSIIEFCLCNG